MKPRQINKAVETRLRPLSGRSFDPICSCFRCDLIFEVASGVRRIDSVFLSQFRPSERRRLAEFVCMCMIVPLKGS